MQFLPSSWEAYGLDANGDGRKDPYNPVDAICAAAHYLKVAGGNDDLYNAIFAYNHADWYVQEVLLYARAYGKLPSDLVGSLTGLTEGAHFPVAADARYADDISARAALKKRRERDDYGNAAEVISSSPTRRGINIFAKEGSPVVAVNDGVIRKIGNSPKLGNYIVLEDAYGNRYTYAELGELVRDHRTVVMPTGKEKRVPVDSQNLRPRLCALPEPRRAASAQAGRRRGRSRRRRQRRRNAQGRLEGDRRHRPGPGRRRRATGSTRTSTSRSARPARARRGSTRSRSSTAGSCSRRRRSTAPRARTRSPKLSGAGVLLLSKEALQRRVLADPGLDDLRMRPRRHRQPARSTAASWRCSSTCSRRASS